jgi:hypothetical protein
LPDSLAGARTLRALWAHFNTKCVWNILHTTVLVTFNSECNNECPIIVQYIDSASVLGQIAPVRAAKVFHNSGEGKGRQT